MKRLHWVGIVLVIMGVFGFVSSSMASDHKQHGKWKVEILTKDGDTLDSTTLSDGSYSPKMVLGKQYRIMGKVPKAVLKQYEGRFVLLEHQPVDDTPSDEWDILWKIRVSPTGHFDKEFITTELMQGERHYRLRMIDECEYTEENCIPDTPTTGTSPTLLAATYPSLTVSLLNDSKADITIFVPTFPDATGTYQEVGVDVNSGDTAKFTYENTQGGAISFRAVRRSGCLGACDAQYHTKWDYAPGKKWTRCSDAPPDTQSGGTISVRLTDQAFSSGFDLFIQNDAVANGVCTAALETNFEASLQDHSALYIIIATEVVAGAVALSYGCWQCACLDVALISAEVCAADDVYSCAGVGVVCGGGL